MIARDKYGFGTKRAGRDSISHFFCGFGSCVVGEFHKLDAGSASATMTITKMLCLNDVRAEARKSVESWARKADDQYKKRYYKYFSDGPEGASPMARGGSGSGASGSQGSAKGERLPSLETFEAAERELELKNWATCYQNTNNSLGPALAAVKARAQGDNNRILEPLLKEVLKPKGRDLAKEMQKDFNAHEKSEFLKLMRSLSIAYEQDRTAYSSEYFIQFEPKKGADADGPKPDYRASSLSAPVTFAPPKVPNKPIPVDDRAATPQMHKPVPRPEGQKGLLAWAGGVSGITTTYRTFHAKPAESYPHIESERQDVSLSCGRTVPVSIVSIPYNHLFTT